MSAETPSRDTELWKHPLVQSLLGEVSRHSLRSNYKLYVPIAKQFKEKDRFVVAGYASVEVIDSQNELIPTEALKEAFEKFMAEGGEYAHCFTSNTLVWNNPEAKPISDIRVGEEVLGLQSERVLALSKRAYEGKILEINPYYFLPVEVTPNHPILILRNLRHKQKRGSIDWYQKRRASLSEAEWVKAGELKETDVLIVPKFKEENSFSDIELAKFIAYYIAEGDPDSGNGVRFVLNKQDNFINFLLHFITKRFKLQPRLYSISDKACGIRVSSRKLSRYLTELCGKGASNKRIPDFIVKAPSEVAREFILAYQGGDGSKASKCNSISTTSRAVYSAITLMLNKLGILPSTLLLSGARSGRFPNAKPSYRLSWYWNEDSTRRSWRSDGDYFFIPIRSIKDRSFKGEVFNLQTENQTYTVPFIVHNCHIMHSNIPVGKVLKEYTDSEGTTWKSGVDDQGLFIVSEVRDDIRKGVQTKELIEKGKLTGYSIGGEALSTSTVCEGKCYTRIDKLEIHEISYVDKPANQPSVFTILKRDRLVKLADLTSRLPHLIISPGIVKIMGSTVELGEGHDYDIYIAAEKSSFIDRAIQTRIHNELRKQGRLDIWNNIQITHEPSNLGPYCYDGETELLTDSGWKPISEITKADKVATVDKGFELIYEYPTFIGSWDYDGPMYHFKGRRIDLLVNPKHKVLVEYPNNSKGWHLDQARNVRKYFKFRGHIDSWNCQDAADLNENKLGLVADYVTEGHLGPRYRISLTQNDNLVLQEMIKHALTLNRHLCLIPHGNGKRLSYCDKELYTYLENEVGRGSYNKRIPRRILNLPPSKLRLFFEKLISRDGYRTKASPIYCTVSKGLADDVAELAFKLGYGVTIRTLKYGGFEVVTRGFRKDASLNRGKHLKIIPFKGKIYGVTVPHHILVVKRNGKICLSGNTDFQDLYDLVLLRADSPIRRMALTEVEGDGGVGLLPVDNTLTNIKKRGNQMADEKKPEEEEEKTKADIPQWGLELSAKVDKLVDLITRAAEDSKEKKLILGIRKLLFTKPCPQKYPKPEEEEKAAKPEEKPYKEKADEDEEEEEKKQAKPDKYPKEEEKQAKPDSEGRHLSDEEREARHRRLYGEPAPPRGTARGKAEPHPEKYPKEEEKAEPEEKSYKEKAEPDKYPKEDEVKSMVTTAIENAFKEYGISKAIKRTKPVKDETGTVDLSLEAIHKLTWDETTRIAKSLTGRRA